MKRMSFPISCRCVPSRRPGKSHSPVGRARFQYSRSNTSNRSGNMTYLSLRPFPCRTWMSPRLLSMSSTRSVHTSLFRKPTPYAVVSATAGTSDFTAANTFSVSVPLKMSGFLCGTLGHDSRSATFGRSSVTP